MDMSFFCDIKVSMDDSDTFGDELRVRFMNQTQGRFSPICPVLEGFI